MMRTALVALLAGAVLTGLTGCGIRIMKYEFSDDHAVAEKIEEVRVRNGSGDVSVRYQSGLTETKIHRRVQHAKDRRPEGATHRVEGNALVLDECGDHCDVDYVVLVPDDKITVKGDTGSGDASVEGLASVDYTTGSGSVMVRDVKGDVRVNVGSGELRASRVGGSLTAEAGSGEVLLDAIKGKMMVVAHSGNIVGTGIDNDITAVASSGNISLTLISERSIRADVGSGDITLRIPGGPFRLTGHSESGDRSITVPTDPSGKNELKLTTGSGDVRVVGI
ncbi:DUF4097 family beta strand repeat-containing protein [Lentzea sp.]|uniref:DUF4097 family beta strand repeat-containing protein n=1 Tax=Lentzea sp. TaxID=56099 RepID=UPI002BF597F3|nr:DUF4097 family beta strand repeat-containing protein [Lentzea sp.]HUQ57560.1 DUF4097 family beta strand repeat-containing protein [Lentzea sp.]